MSMPPISHGPCDGHCSNAAGNTEAGLEGAIMYHPFLVKEVTKKIPKLECVNMFVVFCFDCISEMDVHYYFI